VKDGYTANWTGALRLFDGLIRLRQGDGALYAKAREAATAWLKNHPMKTGRWGPYFDEDSGGSDAQINAESLAWYILESPEWDREWKKGARTILDRSLAAFGSTAWARYGVTALKGRAADRFPGANHTARHAAVELLYSERTGDGSRREASIRQLIWATYMVAKDGRSGCPVANGSSSSLEGSSPPSLEIRLDEGYGDLLRHFLRAMAAAPELAPADQDHILRTSTAVRSIRCTTESITYATAGPPSRERLRVRGTPGKVTAGGAVLPRLQTLEALEKEEGWSFTPLGKVGGILDVRHDAAADVDVRAQGPGN
jgi:hypothetical protein